MSYKRPSKTTACASYNAAKIGDIDKHIGDYVQYRALNGKILTMCKHCKDELTEFKGFLAAMNDPFHPLRMAPFVSAQGDDRIGVK